MNELTSLRRKTLDVTPLTLGVQSIKSQTGFSASAHSAKRNPLTVRNLQVNVLQIVDANIPQANRIQMGHQ